MPNLHHRRPSRGDPRALVGATSRAVDAVPSGVGLDLLRADLYRLLDELAHARPDRHGELVQEFEQAWVAFREGTRARR